MAPQRTSLLAGAGPSRRESTAFRSWVSFRRKQQLSDVDAKHDRLLDVFLDQTITREEYARRKEQHLHEKGLLEEKLTEIRRKGSEWLEPLLFGCRPPAVPMGIWSIIRSRSRRSRENFLDFRAFSDESVPSVPSTASPGPHRRVPSAVVDSGCA